MATAESGDNRTAHDDVARPSWAWPTRVAVSEEESEAWLELEARLRLKGLKEEER